MQADGRKLLSVHAGFDSMKESYHKNTKRSDTYFVIFTNSAITRTGNRIIQTIHSIVSTSNVYVFIPDGRNAFHMRRNRGKDNLIINSGVCLRFFPMV